ncbi:MAG: DNA/RNA nuclease SfsA [Gammaproteobacteria bacterium]|nr:DNA/RNA nuclease SfsA [Gammaproteobacteria bacterium]
MQFPSPLERGTLLRRYQRFLADVELDTGEMITAHCPNTGAMTGCAEPGRPVWLSRSDSKTRKYSHTWELVETAAGLACVHSARANKVVLEALQDNRVEELAGYAELRSEVKYGAGSRVDLLLSDEGRRCYVEVKSVTLYQEGGIGAFPDAVSTRATRHLRELQAVVESGDRAVIFFCVFHSGIQRVRAAAEIDPNYARALAQALAAGVETLAWGVEISPQQIRLQQALPVLAP